MISHSLNINVVIYLYVYLSILIYRYNLKAYLYKKTITHCVLNLTRKTNNEK